MAGRRFKVDDLSQRTVRLAGPQARHALTVLRMTIGDEVILFDGRGAEADGRITAIEGSQLLITAGPPRQVDREPGGLTLAVATPKGDRADWLVEKCAELGVTSIIPLRTLHGVVDPGPEKIKRWRRKTIEAAQQAQSPFVTMIGEVTPLDTLLVRLRDARFYGSPDAALPFAEALHQLQPSDDVLFFVGPEGGFHESEIEAFTTARVTPVRLAGSLLRVETAAIAAAALWAQWKSARFDAPHRPS